MARSDEFDPSAWGEQIAAVHDEWFANFELDTESTVDLLAELAAGGPALELGIGTGRVAIPLQARGVQVDGIEASRAIADRLHTKPEGADISVTIGDIASATTGRSYKLVFGVFNVIFFVGSKDEQLAVFERAAAHLEPGGVFVVEASLPPPPPSPYGSSVGVHYVGDNGVILGFSQNDPVNQVVNSRQVWIRDDRIHSAHVRSRYASPSELDLMARLAGLELRDRWGGWHKEPFTAKSLQHVSVYERA
jgi:SAM-dependent methyltransferase